MSILGVSWISLHYCRLCMVGLLNLWAEADPPLTGLRRRNCYPAGPPPPILCQLSAHRPDNYRQTTMTRTFSNPSCFMFDSLTTLHILPPKRKKRQKNERNRQKGKGKGNVLPRTGHERPEGEQMYNCTLASTSALDGGGCSTPRPTSVSSELNRPCFS